MRKRVLERAGWVALAWRQMWFATITRKIDAMKGLEDQLADGIHQQVLSLRQAARWNVGVSVAANALMLALAVAFGLLVNRVLCRHSSHGGDRPPTGQRGFDRPGGGGRRTNWASCNPRCNTPSSIWPI